MFRTLSVVAKSATHSVNALWALVRCGLSITRTYFWWKKVYWPFQSLFMQSSYSEFLQSRYLSFIAAYVIPLLGPSPSQFKETPPCSYMGDDHTPIELSWVLSSDGKHTVRFTLEPLSGVDGSPTPSWTWINSLYEFSSIGNVQEFNTDWALTCFETLVFEGNNVPKQISQHSSQFSVGADFTHDGIVGKAYFLPHLRSQATGISQMDLVTSCMNELDLGSQWKVVASYFTEAPHLAATPDIVAIDCVHKSKNRAKIYVRCNASSLDGITEVFTLGQKLNGPLIDQAVKMIKEVWHSLFHGKDDGQRLESNNPDHFASRFVLYFELAPEREIPFPKLYIPVRHYCKNDALVGEALGQLYKQEKYGIRETYLRDIQSAFGRTELGKSVGLFTYVGIATRKRGPQLSVYLSPLAFTPN